MFKINWKKLSDMFEKYQFVFLGFILLYAFILRVLYLNFDSMWIDETISAVSALKILEVGYPVLDSGSTYTRALLFHYLIAFFLFIFGENDFGARFISVFFGVLTVYLGYLFGKKFIGNKFGGFAFAILIAVSSMEIIYSKQARMYQAFQFFYFLSFYLFYKFVILKEVIFKRRIYGFLFLLISISISIHLQFMGYIIIPLFIFMYIIHNFNFKKNKFKLLGLTFIIIYFIYYIFNRLNLNLDSYDLALFYSQSYLNFYLSYFPLILIAISGMVYSMFKDFKFNFNLLVYTFVPFVGLFFLKTFATRYVYFAYFVILFYFIYIIDKIKFKKSIFILILILYSTTVFDFNGIKSPNLDPSMPLSDFKGAYNFLDNTNYTNYTLVATWTPAVVWYHDKPCDYWIHYLVSGLENESWTLHSGNVEKFSGAKVIYNISQLPDESFILVLDFQAKRKINNDYIYFFDNNCEKLYQSYNIEVLMCK